MENGLQSWARRKTRCFGKPTDRPLIVGNFLKRNFIALESKNEQVADIREIVTQEKKLFPYVVIDMYSKLEADWSMHDHQDLHMKIRGEEMAIRQRRGNRQRPCIQAASTSLLAMISAPLEQVWSTHGQPQRW